MSDQHIRIQVWGKVQGVGFRASARAEARSLGIDVTAENQPDGTVLINASGPEDQVRSFLEWVHHGPRHARVERVQAIIVDDEGST